MNTKKELKNVSVGTLPNGYSLTVDGNDYMYFSLDTLLEGFMYHVGLCELSAVDNQTIKEFLVAAIVWKDSGGAVKELLKLQQENEALRTTVKNMKERIKTYAKKESERWEENDDENDDV